MVDAVVSGTVMLEWTLQALRYAHPLATVAPVTVRRLPCHRRGLRLVPQCHRDRGRPGQICHERASLARHVVAEASAAAVNELALALAALRAGAEFRLIGCRQLFGPVPQRIILGVSWVSETAAFPALHLVAKDATHDDQLTLGGSAPRAGPELSLALAHRLRRSP